MQRNIFTCRRNGFLESMCNLKQFNSKAKGKMRFREYSRRE